MFGDGNEPGFEEAYWWPLDMQGRRIHQLFDLGTHEEFDREVFALIQSERMRREYSALLSFSF